MTEGTNDSQYNECTLSMMNAKYQVISVYMLDCAARTQQYLHDYSPIKEDGVSISVVQYIKNAGIFEGG